MKKIFLLLTLIPSFTYAVSVDVWHQGQSLKFDYKHGKQIFLDLSSEFQGSLLVKPSRFLTKQVCENYRDMLKFFIADRDPEKVDRAKLVKKRTDFVLLEWDGVEKLEYDMIYKPFGVELDDEGLKEKIAKKLGLSMSSPLLLRINDDYRFEKIELDMKMSSGSILAKYSTPLRNEFLSYLEDTLNKKATGISTGRVEATSEVFEPICDILYFGSEISMKVRAKEPSRIVEEVKVPEREMMKLFNQMKKNYKEDDKGDPFKAGIMVAKSLKETGFVFPEKLAKILGPEREVKFLKSLFEDNFDWTLGRMSEYRKRKILSGVYYVKKVEGDEHSANIKLDVNLMR